MFYKLTVYSHSISGFARGVAVSLHHFGPDWNMLTTAEWIATEWCTDIYGPQSMNPMILGITGLIVVPP